MQKNKTAKQQSITQFRSPGFGRRQTIPHNKGRQLDEIALSEVKNILNGNFKEQHIQRSMLIEYLHAIQDQHGHLSAKHMFALAHIMKLAQAEIFEVASFYAHFNIVLEGETPPPLTLRVCDSLTCALHQSEDLLTQLQQEHKNNIRVIRAPCMGRCHKAPVAALAHNHITQATKQKINQAITKNDTHPHQPKTISYSEYCKNGGYQLAKNALKSNDALNEIINALEVANLRGLGGAGFPTAKKWKLVKQEPAPRLLAVNGDEGEPGTIKDLHYLSIDPHRFLEGVIIAAKAIEAQDAYIYIRDEYPEIIKILKDEITNLENDGLLKHCKLHIRRGAGAYICGEESAMIESIEGKRGLPRHRPPFVAQNGIFGQPTLVNNVETLYWVREIAEKGGEWFQSFGKQGRKGLRSFSVSGRVKNPGVKLAPAGISVRELISEYCNGMSEGHSLKAYLPGGASGGILPESLADLPLDFDTLQEHGCFIGSAAIIVLSQQDNIADVALNLLRFFEDESCGQCTPCRVGCQKAVNIMQNKSWNVELLKELSQTMMQASICGLGQAAPNPILSLFKFFPEDIPQ